MSENDFEFDRLADEFEAAWRIGKQPGLAAFLQRVDRQLRERLAELLISLDIEYRHKAGQTVSAETYRLLGDGYAEIAARCFAESAGARSGTGNIEPTLDSDGSPVAQRGNDDSTRSAPVPAQPSQMIGPYKLLQKLGEGGMGTVWMAEQEKPVRRRVALKLIKAGMDNKQIVARFEAERQALAMMDHQNIAKVLDAGTTDDGSPFFVMELVQGIPFTIYCDQTKLSINERLELFVPVCKAVQHAHQKGIIHRDIKPSNVLVCLYDGKPVPKIIDFGLAKALQHTQKLTDRTMFTEFGQVVGTLQYMSPEQAEMNQLDIDTRTDIYSLGVMLYELLTGSTPIDAETLKRNAILQVLATIREKDPPRPSTRLSSSTNEAVAGISEQRKIDPTKLKNILRGELDWIVMKALEKDRTRRYETANGFSLDVERFLSGDAVSARPPSTGYRLRKYIRKHQGLVASMLAIFAVLAAATVISAFLWHEAVSAREVADQRAIEIGAEKAKADLAKQDAVAQRDLAKQNAETAQKNEAAAQAAAERARERAILALNAQAQAEREKSAADAAMSFFTNDVLPSPSNYGEPSSQAASREIVERGTRALDQAQKLNDQPLVQAQVRIALANIAGKVGESIKRREHIEKAIELFESQLGSNHPWTLGGFRRLANAYRFSGKPDLALVLCNCLVPVHDAVLGPNHPDTLWLKLEMAKALVDLGRIEEAFPCFREVALNLETISNVDPGLYTEALAANAIALGDSGRLAEAIEMLKKSRALTAIHFGDNSLTRALYGSYLASFSLRLDQSAEMEDLLRESAVNVERMLGAGNSQCRGCLDRYTDHLAGNARTSEAEKFIVGLVNARHAGGGDATVESFRLPLIDLYSKTDDDVFGSLIAIDPSELTEIESVQQLIETARTQRHPAAPDLSREKPKASPDFLTEIRDTSAQMQLAALFGRCGMQEQQLQVLESVSSRREKSLGEQHALTMHSKYQLALLLQSIPGRKTNLAVLLKELNVSALDDVCITETPQTLDEKQRVFNEIDAFGFEVSKMQIATERTGEPIVACSFVPPGRIEDSWIRLDRPEQFPSEDQRLAWAGFELKNSFTFTRGGSELVAALWHKVPQLKLTKWESNDEVPRTGKANQEFAVVDELLRSTLRRHDIPGATLAVVKSGKLLHEAGFGYSNIEEQIPMTPGTLMRTPPTSEIITLLTTLKLVQDGKMSLDDPIVPLINKVLGDQGLIDSRWNDVTVRQLILHTSGAPGRFVPAPEVAKGLKGELPVSSLDFCRWLLGQRLAFEPGKKAEYSLCNAVILGRVVEAVTEMDYESAVKITLAQPHNLDSLRLGKTSETGILPGEARYYPRLANTGPSHLLAGQRSGMAYGGGYCLEQYDSSFGWIGSAFDQAKLFVLLSGQEPSRSFSRQIDEMVTQSENLLVRRGGLLIGGIRLNPVNRGEILAGVSGGLGGIATLVVTQSDGTIYSVLLNSDRFIGNTTAIMELEAKLTRLTFVSDILAKFGVNPDLVSINELNDIRDWYGHFDIDRTKCLDVVDLIVQRDPKDQYVIDTLCGFASNTDRRIRAANAIALADEDQNRQYLQSAARIYAASLIFDWDQKVKLLEIVANDARAGLEPFQTIAKEMLESVR